MRAARIFAVIWALFASGTRARAFAKLDASNETVTIACVQFDAQVGYRRRSDCSGWTTRAGRRVLMRYNRLGLRDKDYPPRPAPGVLRVLATGGSLVTGSGLEEKDSPPRALERALARRGIRAEVIDAAVEGYSSWENAGRLKEYLTVYSPKAVVYHLSSHYIFTDRARRPDRAPVPGRLAFLLRGYVEQWDRVEASRRLVSLDVPSRKLDDLLAPTLADLRRMQDLCRAAGARFFIAYGDEEVNADQFVQPLRPPLVARLAQRFAIRPFRFDGAAVAERLHEEGFDVLPLSADQPELESPSNRLPGDYHWNESGAALFGDAVARELAKALATGAPRFERILALLKIKSGAAVLEAGAGSSPSIGFTGASPHRSYELILAHDELLRRPDAAAELNRLRALLSPRGRLVVTAEPNEDGFFTREDFSDWNGFLADIANEPPLTPVGQALAEPIRETLAKAGPRDAARLQERAVLFHLNRVLWSQFFRHFVDENGLKDAVALLPDERAFAWRLARRLRAAGFPQENDLMAIRQADTRSLMMLNKLMLIARFRRRLRRSAPSPYLSAGMESRWLAAHDVRPREIETAGFALERRLALPPYESLWIFSRAAAPAIRQRAPIAASGPGIFIYWKHDLDLLVKTQQAKIPRIKRMLTLLELKVGMKILDIGAGTGQQSYMFAERLRGTGRVFATDIEPKLVDYLAAQARARGLSNLSAVLVAPKGVDGFYGRQVYDMVLSYDNFSFLPDPVHYFREIRGFLSPGGRLVLVSDPDEYPAFAREDFSDWDGFVSALEKEPSGTAFGRELSAPIRTMLAREGAGKDGRNLERIVLFHLNRVLKSDLFSSFVDGSELRKGLALTPDERPFAAWLARRMSMAGLPQRDLLDIHQIEVRDLIDLNKLVVIQRYRKYLKNDSPLPYLSAGLESRWFLDKDFRRKVLESAGYRLERKEDFPPFQAIWVFKDGG